MDTGRYDRFLESYARCSAKVSVIDSTIARNASYLAAYNKELGIIDVAMQAMGAAKELLLHSSLSECERLATHAVRTIFGWSVDVRYDIDEGRFILDYGNGCVSDMSGSQSGGVLTVVSFVFVVYMIIKGGYRRVLFYDESWTQVPADCYGRFIGFVRQVCRDLHFDILLVSHDARLSDDMVDRSYNISAGVSTRVK